MKLQVVTVDTAKNRQLFLEALREILPTLRYIPEASIEHRVGSKQKLVEASEDITSYILSGLRYEPNQNELYALICQVLRCLVSYLKTLGTPITVQNIVNCTHLTEQAMDSSFPGYHSSGLLSYVIGIRKAS